MKAKRRKKKLKIIHAKPKFTCTVGFFLFPSSSTVGSGANPRTRNPVIIDNPDITNKATWVEVIVFFVGIFLLKYNFLKKIKIVFSCFFNGIVMKILLIYFFSYM